MPPGCWTTWGGAGRPPGELRGLRTLPREVYGLPVTVKDALALVRRDEWLIGDGESSPHGRVPNRLTGSTLPASRAGLADPLPRAVGPPSTRRIPRCTWVAPLAFAPASVPTPLSTRSAALATTATSSTRATLAAPATCRTTATAAFTATTSLAHRILLGRGVSAHPHVVRGD